MNNYRVTLDVQMDGNDTAIAFAKALSKTMEITAGVAVDTSPTENARVKLGKTTVTSAVSFTPNDGDV